MAGVVKEGAEEVPRDALREEAVLVAQAIRDLVAGTYGPGGGAVLVDGAAPVTVWSGASALREAGIHHPGAEPYRSLASRLQAHYGDQATTAVLLAAELVARGLDAGLPRSALVDGLSLARRQCLAWLHAQAKQVPPADALALVVPERPDWPATVVDGLRRLHEAGLTGLDHIDIIARDAPEGWMDGIRIDVDRPRRAGPCKVLLLEAAPRDKTRTSISARGGLEWQAAEAGRDRAWYDELQRAGIGLLACRSSLGRHKEALEQSMLVLDNVPADVWRRLQMTTGAVPGIEASDAVPGSGRLRPNPPRMGGHTLSGAAAATWCVLVGVRAWKDDAERLLRAAGIVMQDPRGTAAGWPRELAKHLRAAADAAPGKAPLVLRHVADAVSALDRTAVRNLGLDPLEAHAPPAGLVPSACLEAALDGAFEVARAIMRLDGRYAKRPSQAPELRGGTGPAGSPKGMPGDIPPLM